VRNAWTRSRSPGAGIEVSGADTFGFDCVAIFLAMFTNVNCSC